MLYKIFIILVCKILFFFSFIFIEAQYRHLSGRIIEMVPSVCSVCMSEFTGPTYCRVPPLQGLLFSVAWEHVEGLCTCKSGLLTKQMKPPTWVVNNCLSFTLHNHSRYTIKLLLRVGRDNILCTTTTIQNYLVNHQAAMCTAKAQWVAPSLF